MRLHHVVCSTLYEMLQPGVLTVVLSCLLTLTLQKSLPQVELGYEIHEALSYNVGGTIYRLEFD